MLKKERQLPVFPDSTNAPLVDGEVYAFDRLTGKPQWQSPAVIEGYGVPLNQLRDVPVLVFARRVATNDTRPSRSPVEVIWVDRRDGRLLKKIKEKRTVTTNTLSMVADPQAATVSMQLMNSQDFLLTFTDKARPPEPPAQDGKHVRVDAKPASQISSVQSRTAFLSDRRVRIRRTERDNGARRNLHAYLCSRGGGH